MAQSRGIVKKLGIGFGVFVLLLVGAIVITPFVINVDEYRPRIVALAEPYLNGKLELGKLSLSLWGHVRVNVDGFTLSDAQGRQIATAKNVFFQLPFASLLRGEPVLLLEMRHPEIFVTKDKNGKLGILSLARGGSKSAPAAAAPAKAAAASSSSMGLPSIAMRARLDFEMVSALVAYEDEATGLISHVQDLNITIHDLSLSHPMDFQIWAGIDTRMGKTLTVRGPARITGKAEPHFAESEFQRTTFVVNVDLGDLEILMPGGVERKRAKRRARTGALSSPPTKPRSIICACSSKAVKWM